MKLPDLDDREFIPLPAGPPPPPNPSPERRILESPLGLWSRFFVVWLAALGDCEHVSGVLSSRCPCRSPRPNQYISPFAEWKLLFATVPHDG